MALASAAAAGSRADYREGDIVALGPALLGPHPLAHPTGGEPG